MKLQRVESQDKRTKMNLSFKGSTVKAIEEYRAYYKEVYGDTITAQALIEEMLRTIMREDKSFAKFQEQAREAELQAMEKAAAKSAVASTPAPAASSTYAPSVTSTPVSPSAGVTGVTNR